jgi:amino acid permease
MKQQVQGLSLFGTTLAFVSTIIGGGIVGVPFAFYHAGIPMGLMINFIGAFVTVYSCYLYLKAKDFCGLEYVFFCI